MTPNETNVIRFITSDKHSPQKSINWIFQKYTKDMLEKESVQAALFLQMELYCGLNNLDTSNPPEKVDAKAQRMLDEITPGAINYVIELLSEISPLLFFANEGIFYTYTIWHPNYLDMYTTLSDHYKNEFAEKVLTREGSLITSIRHQTSQMWEWAVSAPGYAWLIKKVPENLTLGPDGMAGIYMSAVKNSGYALVSVPEDEVTPELIKEAFYEVGIGILKEKWFHKLWNTLDNTVRTKYLNNKKGAESNKREKWHAEHQ